MSEIERVGANDLPEISPEVERIVWRNLGIKSAREIAELTGLDATEVVRLKKQLLDEVDVLTLSEKRARILVELQEMAVEARERAYRVDDEFFSGAINSSVAALKAVLVEVARMEKADNSKVEALNQMRINALVKLVQMSVDVSIREIAGMYEIDEDELQGVFNRNLAAAAEELDTNYGH